MTRRITATAALACSLLCAPTPGAASPTRVATDLDEAPIFDVVPSDDEYPGLDLALEGLDHDGNPGRISVTVPSGFELYPERPTGSLVGLGLVFAGDASYGSSAVSMLQGQVVAEPLDPAAEAAAQACSPGNHLALWNLSLSLLGQPLQLPIYLSRNDSDLRLDLCTPPVTAAGPLLPFQAIHLLLPELRAPRTAGVYTWRAEVTPTAPDRHTLLPDRAYEVRASVPVPNLLTLHARYDAKHRTAILRGSLRSAGKPRARVRVVFTSLIRKVTPHGVEYHDAYAGSTRTNAAGAFLIRKKIKRTTGFLATAASTISACTGTSTAPAGCLSATTAGTRSEPITVSVPGR